MRRLVMRRNELPDFCLSTLPSSGQLIILRRGERGYYASDWDTGKREEIRTSLESIIGGGAFLTYRRPP